MNISRLLQIGLHPADKVVSVTSHQGYLIIVTMQGVVYKIMERDAP